MEQIDILSEQNVLGVGEEEELAPGQGNATNGIAELGCGRKAVKAGCSTEEAMR